MNAKKEPQTTPFNKDVAEREIINLGFKIQSIHREIQQLEHEKYILHQRKKELTIQLNNI